MSYFQEGMKSAVGGSSTKVKVSLRGVGPSVDTTEVSKRYGGGGHRLASGFVIEAAELEAWRVA